MSSAIRIDG